MLTFHTADDLVSILKKHVEKLGNPDKQITVKKKEGKYKLEIGLSFLITPGFLKTVWYDVRLLGTLTDPMKDENEFFMGAVYHLLEDCGCLRK